MTEKQQSVAVDTQILDKGSQKKISSSRNRLSDFRGRIAGGWKKVTTFFTAPFSKTKKNISQTVDSTKKVSKNSEAVSNKNSPQENSVTNHVALNTTPYEMPKAPEGATIPTKEQAVKKLTEQVLIDSNKLNKNSPDNVNDGMSSVVAENYWGTRPNFPQTSQSKK